MDAFLSVDPDMQTRVLEKYAQHVQECWQAQLVQPQPGQHWQQPGCLWQGDDWGMPLQRHQLFEQALPCMPAPKRLQHREASPLVDPGRQQLEASGSLPLSGQLTTLAHPGVGLGQQLEGFSGPESPEHAGSLADLPSLGSLPPLGSPLIAAAVPAADVPINVAHFAACRVPPPVQHQLKQQAQQQQRTMQPPSQESCAGFHQPLQGGPLARDGASTQPPAAQPRQPASITSLERLQAAADPEEPEDQVQHMLSLARELGLLSASEPSSPAGGQPSWAPLMARCTPPPPGPYQRPSHQQPGESELLRQFSGQLDLPLMDTAPAAGPAELLAPQVLQPALEGQMPTAPQVQLRPAGRPSPQPQQRPSSAQRPSPGPGAAHAAEGAPALLTPAAVPHLQRPQQQQPAQQQRKEKKGAKSKQEQKAKQLQLKQKALKKKQGGKPAGRKPAAASPAQPKRASGSPVQQLLLDAGMDGFAEAMATELRRHFSERQAAEAAARHSEQRRLLQEAQAQQRRQLELAQQAQLLQLERAQLLWQSRRAAELRPAAPRQLPASPQLERQTSQALLLAREPVAQPPLGQRTLSAQLSAEELLVAQRAAHQMWAHAATRLVGRAGSVEPGSLPLA
ncbi:hypothetical protein C2E21_2165 [Chlorella sorokiniana]|uniref:Uncharacterized protein n=1 Tax=Chlorella sorokiniana TaxID=3076 RepID=A0A2P6TXM4_CHLSO|nr:hypothetical protein C2E21_2165 [Chlorella sorokiniana]|eukprot:PRW58815.1 hypothetical protein C2E21_2165 [Chlorella sorokiniana]